MFSLISVLNTRKKKLMERTATKCIENLPKIFYKAEL